MRTSEDEQDVFQGQDAGQGSHSPDGQRLSSLTLSRINGRAPQPLLRPPSTGRR